MYDVTHRCGCKGACRCRCKPERFNFYGFPAPINKEMKRLDTTELTIHTDEVWHKEWRKKGCCPPELITVVNEKKSFIISAATNCLEPNTYYTLLIDRETPIFEVSGLDTYINVEPCGFFRGEVGLNYTKTIRKVWCDHDDPITGEHEELESLDVEGGMDGFEENFSGNGPIPKDPAYPAQNFAGCGFHKRNGVLVPVVLDLHGNIANGKNFSTGRFTVPGVGRPYNNRFVLYYNNAGKFVLCRDFRRRSDYA